MNAETEELWARVNQIASERDDALAKLSIARMAADLSRVLAFEEVKRLIRKDHLPPFGNSERIHAEHALCLDLLDQLDDVAPLAHGLAVVDREDLEQLLAVADAHAHGHPAIARARLALLEPTK